MTDAAASPAAGDLRDPVDRLLRDEATGARPAARTVALVDDPTGELSCAAAATRARVRVFCDSLLAERAVRGLSDERSAGVEVLDDLDAAVAGATLVMARVPRSLAALDALANSVARCGDRDAALLVGARIRHLSRGMNDVLAGHFGQVRASLGRDKCRVLVASSPGPAAAQREPAVRLDADLDLLVCSHPGAFAAGGVDAGSRLLLRTVAFAESTSSVADLGCGTGVLAAALARSYPSIQVLATDESWAAVRSARATAELNGVTDRVRVVRMDGLESVPDGSLDAVVCNPPFHRGPAKDSSVAFAMIEDAARALRAGGRAWVVFNSHLPYLPALHRAVGPTRVAARNRSFLVTCSTRRGGPPTDQASSAAPNETRNRRHQIDTAEKSSRSMSAGTA